MDVNVNREELEEYEALQLQEMEEALGEGNDLHYIENLSCQIDLLQDFLGERGFRPFMRNIDLIWYDNVISNDAGYTAFMKVVSPEGILWSLTVVGTEEDDSIVQVERKHKPLDPYKRLRSVFHKGSLGAVSLLVEDRLGFYEVSVFKPDHIEPLSLVDAVQKFRERSEDPDWKRIF